MLIVTVTVLIVGSHLMGLKTYTVLSGSMEPVYHTGSVIYVKAADYNKLSPGDVITFMIDENTVVTHRITEIIPDEMDESVVRFRTKGDANSVEDANPVHCRNVIGVPVASIPYLGFLITYMKSTSGKIVTGIIAIFLTMFVFIPKSFWNKQAKN